MKRIYIILVAVLLTASVFAQAPQKMTYQAVVRDYNSTLITNTQVGIEINIYQGSTTGTLVYNETQTPTTNVNGLLTIEIGGQTGFDAIDWVNGPYFIETNIDPAGGTNYTITGVSQLLTVPYALHAKTAESITGGINETDPVYANSQAVNITSTDITNLSNLSGVNTGDQDISGIATNEQAIQDTASKIRADIPNVSGFITTETDPVYTNSQAVNITSTDITNLSNLSGVNTGDQDISGIAVNTQALQDTASQIRADIPDVSGFITTETDPVYTAWNKSYNDLTDKPAITDTVTTVLDTTTQFVRTEVDGSVTNEIQDLDLTGNTLTITNNASTTNIDLSTYLDNTDNQSLDNVLTQSNDGGAKQIKNIADPTDAQDAVTKTYVDQIMQIMVNNGLTIVDFSADNTTIAVGSNVIFSDNSTINPTTWSWDFGDGNTAITQNPTHAYTSVGTYTVILTASNGTLTQTKTKTNYITVSTGGSLTVTDIDGNTYPTVILGTQEWMAENLKVTHYPNGDLIPLVIDNTAWANLVDNNPDDAMCYYNNDASGTASTYGALYTYAAAIGDDWTRDNTVNQGVCPDGWHLPTDAEWTTLTNYLGGESVAGGKMKEIGTTHWNSPNIGADNSSGFSALPGGCRYGSNGSFNDLGRNGYWWSATEYDSNDAYYRNLYYGSTPVYRGHYAKSNGFSVRCVRD